MWLRYPVLATLTIATAVAVSEGEALSLSAGPQVISGSALRWTKPLQQIPRWVRGTHIVSVSRATGFRAFEDCRSRVGTERSSVTGTDHAQ